VKDRRRQAVRTAAISPLLWTNTAKMEADLESPYILIYDKKIRRITELIPILEASATNRQTVLIIADEEVEGSMATSRGQQQFAERSA